VISINLWNWKINITIVLTFSSCSSGVTLLANQVSLRKSTLLLFCSYYYNASPSVKHSVSFDYLAEFTLVDHMIFIIFFSQLANCWPTTSEKNNINLSFPKISKQEMRYVTGDEMLYHIYCIMVFEIYGTTQVQPCTCSHKSICLWLNNHWGKGRSTHFTSEYPSLQVFQQYSQTKWVPCLFTQWLVNHEQIDSCEEVQCCAWESGTIHEKIYRVRKGCNMVSFLSLYTFWYIFRIPYLQHNIYIHIIYVHIWLLTCLTT